MGEGLQRAFAAARLTRKAGGMSHKQAIEGVRDLITLKGGKCWVLSQSGRLFGSAGIPDCYCIMRNHRTRSAFMFWVEVKVGRDKQSSAQIEFDSFCTTAGVDVVVGTSLDVEKYLEHKLQ